MDLPIQNKEVSLCCHSDSPGMYNALPGRIDRQLNTYTQAVLRLFSVPGVSLMNSMARLSGRTLQVDVRMLDR